MTANNEYITATGVKVHNLKDITVKIPRHSFTVITGPSGSGKSSLAFDTIFAESQRRYITSLSLYARQYIRQMQKPDAKEIKGISPGISIDQRRASYNPRSTVGTTTEIYDYMRLLFAKAGIQHCHICKKPAQKVTEHHIRAAVASSSQGKRVRIYAPLIRQRKGVYTELIQSLGQKGYLTVRVDGTDYDVDDTIEMDRNKLHDIAVHIDSLETGEKDQEHRLEQAMHRALAAGSGILQVVDHDTGKETFYSTKSMCVACNVSYPEWDARNFSFNSPTGACKRCSGMGEIMEKPCPSCDGRRLKDEVLAVLVGGVSISRINSMSVTEARDFFSTIEFTTIHQAQVAAEIIREIDVKLGYLSDLGLSYLTLDRKNASLSGGELQRVRLAAQLGQNLVGAIYVLDEPSIGLHVRDNKRLIQALKDLRDKGNTVLVVEHDRDTMEGADYILDLGPGAGVHGGEVVSEGTVEMIKNCVRSLTGAYLRGEKEIPVPLKRRSAAEDKHVCFHGLTEHNLKGADVSVPLGMFVCITGVSGSGKSTLMMDVIQRYYHNKLYGSLSPPSGFELVENSELVDKLVVVDQSPIGKTPRSNPSTYAGVFGDIRDMFARLTEARMYGYKPGRFSFNVKGGRCEACKGSGINRITMNFLPDTFIECELCHGKRFNEATLAVRYKGLSIHDVLDLTVEEACSVFENIPRIARKLAIMNDIGLGYLTLGQPSPTLSGGESQRLKLAAELFKKTSSKTLYLLDEPTTGLHFCDIQRLLDVLNKLVDRGGTVVVIEHNMEVIKCADHIIDLGPEGGEEGGRVVAVGTPEQVMACDMSYTGRALREYLNT